MRGATRDTGIEVFREIPKRNEVLCYPHGTWCNVSGVELLGILVSNRLGKSLNKKRPAEAGQVKHYGMMQCWYSTYCIRAQHAVALRRWDTGIIGHKKMATPIKE